LNWSGHPQDRQKSEYKKHAAIVDTMMRLEVTLRAIF